MPPIRDFVCANCDHEFEKIVKTDELQTECPNCEKKMAVAKLSAPKQFNFKGPGFYETDYKRKY